MAECMLIAVGAALVNNVVLSQFLGLCPFLGVSKNVKTAAGMGGAVVFVITISLNLEYLQRVESGGEGARLDRIVEMILKKFIKPLYEALGVYLPLITTNCAVLGVAISNIDNGYNFAESLACSFGTSFGFLISIVILAGIREKAEHNNIPKPFQGTPIVLVSAGLMAIAFTGFTGVI